MARMSDGAPNDPTKRQEPWDAKLGEGDADPPGSEGGESSPTEVTPTPEPSSTPDATSPEPIAGDPAQPGLISAAPVGWGAQPGSPIATPMTPAPPGPGGPTVGWAPPTQTPEVPGAPGLAFADTVSRFVAYIVDAILIGIVGSIIAGVLGFGRTTISQGGTNVNFTVSDAAFSVPFAIVGLVYFVFFWTGGRRATIGQRIFNMQVGNAFDGRGLTLEQAVRRWLGYGTFLGLFALIPGVYGIASLAELIWVIVLLITTATSPTKQGLHDRFANTAVVRPAGQGSSGLALACVVIIAILVILSILGVVALVIVGSQMSTILSEIGDSI